MPRTKKLVEGAKEEAAVTTTVVVPSKEEQIAAVVGMEKESKSSKMKMLYDMGLGIKEIAQTLNVRYNFVYNVISNYCIIKGVEMIHVKRTSKKDSIMKLFDAGKTVKEVAIELKTNYQYVYKLHKEWKQLAVKDAEKNDKVVNGEQTKQVEDINKEDK